MAFDLATGERRNLNRSSVRPHFRGEPQPALMHAWISHTWGSVPPVGNSVSPDRSCSRCRWGRRGVCATRSRESLQLGPILGGHMGVIGPGEGYTNPSSCPAAW